MNFKQTYRKRGPLLLFFGVLYTLTAGLVYLAATRDCVDMPSYDRVRLIIFILLLPLLIKYAFQLTGSTLYSVFSRRMKQAITAEQPTVTVIIPAWNEEVGIERTLWSVINTAYSRLQVVVVNDGSSDGTHGVMTRILSQYRPDPKQKASIKYLNLPNGGKARAMNRAMVHATGEIIMTIDADSIMDPDAIANMVKQFDDPQVGGVAGNVIVGNRRKPIELMQQMEYLYGFFLRRADSLFNSVYIIGGAAAAYRREVLDRMGGFDHSIITEDIEMSMRILSHGYKTRYACDAVVYTEGPSELKGLCNQRLRWTYGRIMTFLRHRNLFFSTRSHHSPYLTFMLLPMAVYADLVLLLTPIVLLILAAYSIQASDYVPLLLFSMFMSLVVSVQALIDPKARFHRNILLIAPVAWLLCYAVSLIEYQAMIRSLKRLATRKELKWQKWVRVGVVGNGCLARQPVYD